MARIASVSFVWMSDFSFLMMRPAPRSALLLCTTLFRAATGEVPGSPGLLHFRAVGGGRFGAEVLPDRHALVGVKASCAGTAEGHRLRRDYVPIAVRLEVEPVAGLLAARQHGVDGIRSSG